MHKTVILAGGGGTRLWPISRTSFPKQFLALEGKDSFLQKCVRRALSFTEPKDVVVVTSQEYESLVHEQLQQFSNGESISILGEPMARNTASAILLAIAYCKEKLQTNEKTAYMVMPSDQLISPMETFTREAKLALEAASHIGIVLFGIPPTKPHTGYGYIKMGKKATSSGIFSVEKFYEKPSSELAKRYLKEGDFLWNAGIFIFTQALLEEECRLHAPQLLSFFSLTYQECLKAFSQMPSVSFDYAILERCDRVFVKPLACQWSDVGSWENLYDLCEKDQDKNVMLGRVLAIEARGCLFVSQKRTIVAQGIEDLAIVDSGDILLITKLNLSQNVRQLAGFFEKEDKERVSLSPMLLDPACHSIVPLCVSEGAESKMNDDAKVETPWRGAQRSSSQPQQAHKEEGVAIRVLGKET